MKNYLENQVNNLLDYMNESGLGFGFKLHPNRNHLGTYISGEPFDYIIFSANGVHCFDTKQTVNDKWRMQKKDLKQIKNLYSLKKFNKNNFFIIYFIKKNKLMKISVEDVFNILKTRRYVMQSDCITWNWKEDFGIGS